MKVVPIVQCADIPKMLRDLAERIESGEDECDRVTVIAGSSVMCFGPVDECRAAEGAIFDMTFGIHAMMALPAMLKLDGEL